MRAFRNSMLLVAGVGVVVGLAALTSQIARPAWAAMRLQAVQPPCPSREWNPFALRGSAIGRVVSEVVMDSAESAHHLGVHRAELPAITSVARALDKLADAGQPGHAHEHACEDHDHDEDEHEHEGHDAAHCAHCIALAKDAQEMARLEQIGDAKVRSAVKWAYLLDPTNVGAMESYAGSARASSAELVQIQDASGGAHTISTGSWRALQLFEFSLPRFDVESGIHPEDCLGKARTMVAIWTEKFSRDRYDNESGADRQTRMAALAVLRRDVGQLVKKARSQQQALANQGRWEYRAADKRSQFERRVRECAAFVREATQSLTKESGALSGA